MKIDELEKKLNKSVDKALNRGMMTKYMHYLSYLIKKRVKLGRGVKQNGETSYKFDKLKDNTKKKRKKLKKQGKLSNETTPNRSNLTESGKLVNSISGKSSGSKSGTIYLKENRTDGYTNKEIHEYVSKDREFFKISKAEKKKVTRMIKDEILKSLKGR